MTLPNHRPKGVGTVFSGRYNKIFHQLITIVYTLFLRLQRYNIFSDSAASSSALCTKTLHHFDYGVFHLFVVVVEERAVSAVGYDKTYCQRLVTHD